MNVFLPRSLEELWQVWEANPDARIYAGGTDLLVKFRNGLPRPPVLLCLERVPELREVREEEGAIVIGAGVTHTAALKHPLVRKHAPVLSKGLRVLGSPLIRNMGTLGGNLVTASPAGDSLPALYVLDAEIILARPDGNRSVPIHRFIQGPGQTALNPREIVSGIRIRKLPPWTVSHYEKVGKRKAMAIAVASLAACCRLAPDGTVTDLRLAWGSVGPAIVTAPEVEKALKGERLTLPLLKDVAPLVRKAISPIDDIRASAAYRERVAVNLLARLATIRPLQTGEAS